MTNPWMNRQTSLHLWSRIQLCWSRTSSLCRSLRLITTANKSLSPSWNVTSSNCYLRTMSWVSSFINSRVRLLLAMTIGRPIKHPIWVRMQMRCWTLISQRRYRKTRWLSSWSETMMSWWRSTRRIECGMKALRRKPSKRKISISSLKARTTIWATLCTNWSVKLKICAKKSNCSIQSSPLLNLSLRQPLTRPALSSKRQSNRKDKLKWWLSNLNSSKSLTTSSLLKSKMKSICWRRNSTYLVSNKETQNRKSFTMKEKLERSRTRSELCLQSSRLEPKRTIILCRFSRTRNRESLFTKKKKRLSSNLPMRARSESRMLISREIECFWRSSSIWLA